MHQASIVEQFVEATNAGDAPRALRLFAPTARLDDASVGAAFVGTEGVRRYLEQYFFGYHTRTKVVAESKLADGRISAQVDFTGDFGHETGGLTFTLDETGLITAAEAFLD